MSMRSVATLTLQVGPLIGIPVKAYKATDDPKGGLEFRQIHGATIRRHLPCGTRLTGDLCPKCDREPEADQILTETCGEPINRPSVCRACAREIAFSEIKKGYALTPTEHIVIEESDLKALRPERDGQMAVETYLPIEELDPSYFDGTVYRLMPSSKDTVAFVTWRDALAGRYALAKVVMYGKERVVAIRAEDRALAMHFLRSKAEVRRSAEMPGYDHLSLFARPEHVELMRQLIDGHENVAFEDVAIAKDRYVSAVQRMIADRISGLEPSTAVEDAPTPAPVADIMAALQASLAARKVA